MQPLESLFNNLNVSANIFHNGQYLGDWAIDTSGSSRINFHLVSSGSCYLTLAGKPENTISMQEGDLVIFPSDSPHVITNNANHQIAINASDPIGFKNGVLDTATGLICGNFVYSQPLLHRLTEHLPDYVILHRDQVEKSSLGKIIQALIIEAQTASDNSGWLLNKLAETMLAIVFRDNFSQEKGILALLTHPQISHAIHAIHLDPQVKWTLDQLAERCHMSRASFSQTFKQLAEMTPMEYITFWRLSLACNMLESGNASVIQAAQASGYDNESSFSKAFKRVLGTTPGAVREKFQKSHSTLT